MDKLQNLQISFFQNLQKFQAQWYSDKPKTAFLEALNITNFAFVFLLIFAGSKIIDV
jgi:hypothetical protein